MTSLKDWHDRPVTDIAKKREDLRCLHQGIRKNHREAIANQVRRLHSTVYNYYRDGSDDDMLPAFPKKAAPLFPIAARDWAFSHATVLTKKGEVERAAIILNLPA